MQTQFKLGDKVIWQGAVGKVVEIKDFMKHEHASVIGVLFDHFDFKPNAQGMAPLPTLFWFMRDGRQHAFQTEVSIRKVEE